MKNFALIGAAGYIAPRHLQAIKDTNNKLVAAVDPHDSVGILDRYFPEAAFFTEFERFDRHLELLKRKPDSNEHVNYVTICSPNHLHDAHIRTALRIGADVICEKPLVLNPWNLDGLEEIEEETHKKIYTILQLRVHPALLELKSKIDSQIKLFSPLGAGGKPSTFNLQPLTRNRFNVQLTYITSRGYWYDYSWKGVREKSGGIGTNIGIHFFDLLIWLFGDVKDSWLHINETKRMSGFIALEHADVSWYLSLNKENLPQSAKDAGKPTYRSITINGEEIQFSEGFTDLHTRVYEEILAGRGFGIKDARPSITLVQQLRDMKPQLNKEGLHPFVQKVHL